MVQYIPQSVFDDELVDKKMTEMRMAIAMRDSEFATFMAMEFASTVLRVGLAKCKTDEVKKWLIGGYDATVHDKMRGSDDEADDDTE